MNGYGHGPSRVSSLHGTVVLRPLTKGRGVQAMEELPKKKRFLSKKLRAAEIRHAGVGLLPVREIIGLHAMCRSENGRGSMIQEPVRIRLKTRAKINSEFNEDHRHGFQLPSFLLAFAITSPYRDCTRDLTHNSQIPESRLMNHSRLSLDDTTQRAGHR
ncbi:uncharacterized protein BJX67DRAFT_298565 [Aspergillus lucknowensis]|uniref:Uncharacterized protein n=1 Tax=Aspergillus lucknowensis TaxID=176173 RepID=A0ABR4LCV6_9EURO